MKYYDRKTKRILEEKEFGGKSLEFLYNTIPGRFLLKLFFARPIFSKLASVYYKSSLSKRKIKKFVEKYNIDIDKEYKSFNEFFIRDGYTENNQHINDLVSIANGKLSIYRINDDLRLNIKHSSYSLIDILEDTNIAKFFKNGTCLVYRLSVNDNHRYNYLDDGTLSFHKKIKGKLHTIRPIAKEHNVYTQNTREISLLNTKNLDYVVQIEVGALLIGKIKNNRKLTFHKNEEKGYFEFGGSTIVILLNKNIEFDEDIIKANNEGLEVQVTSGEKIGVII